MTVLHLRLIATLCLSGFLVSNQAVAETINQAQTLNYKIIAERTHKTSIFTQGLEVHEGKFYESSGLYNKSFFVSYTQTEPQSAWAKLTAPFAQKQNVDSNYFAEGMTLWNQKIYLLTWKEQTVFIYSATDFKFLSSLHYQGEGWGLTHNDHYLIRSDGSDKLYFHSPDDFHVIKTISVKLNAQPIKSLNELEYVDGFIYANIWQDNRVLKIDADTGVVVGYLDFSSITKSLRLTDQDSVLNGIAYDSEQKAFWLTGKLWPKLYLIRIW